MSRMVKVGHAADLHKARSQDRCSGFMHDAVSSHVLSPSGECESNEVHRRNLMSLLPARALGDQR